MTHALNIFRPSVSLVFSKRKKVGKTIFFLYKMKEKELEKERKEEAGREREREREREKERKKE